MWFLPSESLARMPRGPARPFVDVDFSNYGCLPPVVQLLRHIREIMQSKSDRWPRSCESETSNESAGSNAAAARHGGRDWTLRVGESADPISAGRTIPRHE